MVTLYQRRRITDRRKVTEADLDARIAEWRRFHAGERPADAGQHLRRATWAFIATVLLATVAAATYPLWA